MRHLQVEEYRIKSNKIPRNFDKCRIVFLTDLHDQTYEEDNNGLVEMIEAQFPDYIMAAGDLVTGRKNFDGSTAVSLLGRLAEKYEVYYTNGNHEKRLSEYSCTKDSTYVEFKEQIEETGTRYLINESAYLIRGNEQIRVTGLDIGLEYYKKKWHKVIMKDGYIPSLVGKASENWYEILLAHNPDYFPQYGAWGADLVLSGHVHGGIIRFPVLGGLISPSYRFFPKYDSGLFHEGKTYMVLSRGLGSHTIKLRIANVPELSVITLERE